VKVKEEVNAAKERRGPEEALELAKAAARIVVAKGKKVTILDLKKDAPDDETLLKHLLGPSGNLRAPTMRRGKTLFVGFHEEEFPALVVGGRG
jgi:arsenate reductase-like glutaredoxin family protein